MRLASPNLPLLAFAAAATAASCCAAEAAPEPEYIFTNPPAFKSADYRIPTSYESAVLGRRILALTPLGTLSTVFPSSSDAQFSSEEDRPHGLAGMPLGLMDYVADCEGEGNPTILAINIATSFKNVRAGSNISLAQHWTPRYPPDKRIKSTGSAVLDWFLGRDEDDSTEEGATTSYSAANLPRFNLLGYLEKIDDSPAASREDLAACFVATHPDARYWLPGNRIHASEFVRLVVTRVYWIGGFGDRAYIGWIPVDEWKNVTRAEWERVTLPGEKKGWKEWSAEL